MTIFKKQMFQSSSLEEYSKSRSDIFSIYRLFAAFLVLYAHAYHIFGLGADPLTKITGYYTGTLAVYVFFSISGYFIIKSAIDRNILQFCLARLSRIYPALIVANILTILLIIPLGGDVIWSAFVISPEAIDYIKINSMLDTLKFSIHGVFGNNPDQAINGSLWTLPVEFRAYVAALLVSMVGLTSVVSRFNAVFIIMLFLYSKIPGTFELLFPVPGSLTLLLFFFLGAFFYINRRYIPVSPILLTLSITLIVFFRDALSPSVIAFIFVYAVISSGYLLSKIIPFRFDSDYSYGCYLYAYPLSQVSYMLFNNVSFVVYFSFIVLSTLLFSFLSWHYVEKPVNILVRSLMFSRFNTVTFK